MKNYRPIRATLLPLMLVLAAAACRAELPPPSSPPAPSRDDGSVTPPPDGGPVSPDQGLPLDTAPPDLVVPDGAPDQEEGTEADTEAPSAACGNQRPDVTAIVGADGLAIDPDGTIYYTQGAATATGQGFVGRMRPGAPAEPKWLPIPLGGQLGGLALDEVRQRLYVLATGNKSIRYVDLSGPGATAGPLTTLASGLPTPSDIAVGPDGHIYYTAEADRQVYRLSPGGTQSMVTTSPTHARLVPSGLAFTADGTLLVGSAGVAPVLRLTLAASGLEQSRRPHGFLHTWVDGLTADSRGRVYLVTHSATSEARVLMIVEDESVAIQVAAGAGFGSLTFGRGALDCNDLYIAVPSGGLLRLATDVSGW
jgi:sugar lactone lactonase YvrE